MRIIDKNQDYYDFYQRIYPDAYLVFDRRGSVIVNSDLIRDMQCRAQSFNVSFYYENDSWILYFILESGYDRWVFYIEYTYRDGYSMETEDIDVLHFKDYKGEPKELSLSVMKIPWMHIRDEQDIVRIVENGDFTRFWEIKKPILKDCEFAGLVDAFDLYNSIEEFLSFVKTKSERTESIGITDKEKIVNHGFDTKKSFRGKK